MTRILVCGSLLCASVLAGMFVPGSSGTMAQAQDKKGKDPFYFGNGMCAQCHNYGTLEDAKDKLTSVDFTRGTEMRVWDKLDKHKYATEVLKDERSKQMAEILKIKGDLTKEKQCISCHGVYVENEKFADKKYFSPDKREASGVSCVACHGPYAAWVNEHAKIAENVWQNYNREEKETKFGMTDLWDPVKRATLCASCHVGNSAEGKVVTHEMYAAGHPPLPSFEVASFCDAMPRHWETWQEKLKRQPDKKDLYAKGFQFSTDPPEWQQTRLAVLGSVATFRESMNLVAKEAELGARDEKHAWPELAVFDCYACHHDLKTKSWRQERGYEGPPGRPTLRPWPTVLLPLGLQHVSRCSKPAGEKEQKELAQEWSELNKVLFAQPFGEPTEVAAKARKLATWSDDLLKELRGCRFDKDKAKKLLVDLVHLAEERSPDFDAARELAWAFKAMAPEILDRKDANPLLGDLRSTLLLDLPQGQVRIAPDFLRSTLRQMYEYDPEKFREKMATLADSLR